MTGTIGLLFFVLLPAAVSADSLTMDRTNYLVGESPVFTISGAAPGTLVYWSGWKDGVSTGEVDVNYDGQTTDGSGALTVTGGAWQSGHEGFWTKQLNVAGVRTNVYFKVSTDLSSLVSATPSDPVHALSASHVAGDYRFTSEPFLIEGAKFIQNLGTDAVFIYLMDGYSGYYPNTDFGAGPITSLTSLAQTSPYQQLFNMPYKTYVLTTYSFANYGWVSANPRGSFTGAAAETAEISALVQHLRNTYGGTGKTFVIKDWEGDWQMKQNFDSDSLPTQSQVDGWIAFHQARYQGVQNGIAATPSSAVPVKYAIEFNLLTPAQRDRLSVLKSVVSAAGSDYLTYSSYQTINSPATANLRRSVLDDIAFIRSYTGVAGRPLLISEYGFAERVFSDSGSRTQIAAQAFLDAAIPQAYYWQIIDNECGEWPVLPNIGDCRGWGLVRQDGTYAPAWDSLKSLVAAQNNAAFVSQSVPAAVTAGQAFSVSITMSNSGGIAWDTVNEYRLGSQNPQDNSTWGFGRVNLATADNIAPGESKTFTFDATAPATPGAYNFQWKMLQEGVEWFGALTTNVAITVSPAADTTPPVISGVGSSAITYNSATISWTTDEGSDSQVEYGLTAAYGNSTALNSSMVTGHSAGLSSLSAGTLYHYRVKSRDAAGNLGTSADYTFTTSAAPDTTPPANITTVNDGTGADIIYATSLSQLSANWTASSDAQSGIARYWYAAGATPGGTNIVGWTDNGVGAGVTRSGLSLANGQTYYFTVKAENGAGLQSGVTNSNGQTVDTTAPSNISAVNDGTGADITYTTSLSQLSANWSASSDAQSGIARYWYAIGTTPGATDVAAWTNNGAGAGMTRSGLSLANGQVYYFTVKAENGAGLQSAAADSNGQTVDTTAPSDITTVSDGAGADIAFTASLSQLTANWTASSDAQSGIARYRYAIGTAPGGTNIAGWTDNGANTAVTRSGLSLANGQVYYFTVKAENGAGLQSAAADSNGQTVDATAPSNITAVNDGTGADIVYSNSASQLAANWTASVDAQSGVAKYWYAIGDTPGGANVAGWTDNGAGTGVNRAGLSLANGQIYYFTVKAENGAGLQSAAADSNGQTVDATAPADITAVNDGTGADITYTTSLSQLSATWAASSDAESGVSRYRYAIGTAPGGANIAGWTDNNADTSVTKTGLTLANGQIYYFTVKAENGAGLQSAAADSNGQTVDTTPPSNITAVSDGTGADIAYTTSLSQLSANWTASSDAQSGVARYWYAVGTAAGASNVAGWRDNGLNTSTTASGLTLANGQVYYFTVKAENGAGLQSAAANSNGQRADWTAPAGIGSVSDGTGADVAWSTSASRLSANWGASSDGESGVARYWYGIGTAPGGTDIVGWKDNGVGRSTTAAGLALSEGQIYFFAVKAENGAGLQSAAADSNGQTVDMTAPNSSVSGLGQYTNGASFNVQWSGGDVVSGLVSSPYDVQYKAGAGAWADWVANSSLTSKTFGPASPVAVQDGQTYSFRCRARDNAGNAEAYPAAPDASATVDVSSPSAPALVSPTHEAGQWNVISNSPQFNWTASDAGSGLAGYSAALERSAGFVPGPAVNLTGNTTTFANIADGSWYFHARTGDNAGNWSQSASYGPIMIDLISPAFTITPSRNPAPKGDIVVTIAATEQLSVIAATVTQSGGGASAVALTSADNITWTGSYPVVSGYDGTAAIEVWGRDIPGKSGAGSASFTVDTASPSAPSGLASATHPENTPTSNAGPVFTWTASADPGGSGVAGYSWAVAQSADYALDLGTETAAASAGVSKPDGTYWFHVRGVDNAGNGSPAASYKFIIDVTSPVYVTSYSRNPAKAGGLALTVNAGEALKATPSVGVRQAGQGAATGVTMTSSDNVVWSGDYTVVSGYDGAAEVTISGSDLADNTGAGNSAFLADTVGPSAAITLSPGGALGTGPFTATLTITDAGAINGAPVLAFTPAGAQPVSVALSGSEKSWTGRGYIESVTSTGTAAFAFLAEDAAGNAGTAISAGNSFEIDTSVDGAGGGAVTNSDETGVVVEPGTYGGAGLLITIATPDPNRGDIAQADGRLSGPVPVAGANLRREYLAWDAATGAPVVSFSRPVTLIIAYADADNDGLIDGAGVRERRAGLFWLNPAAGNWEEVANASPDFASNKISARVTHFSVYSILTVSPESAVYPVPWKPGSGGRFDSADDVCGSGIIFDNLPLEAVIRIYNYQGDLIRELRLTAADNGCMGWDGKNAAGRDAASGVYLALIKTPSGAKTIKKLAIER